MTEATIAFRKIFQSTLPYGSDVTPGMIPSCPSFQSTLPYGSDDFDILLSFQTVDFNPRSLTGATTHRQIFLFQLAAFQSTLPYGSDHITPANIKATGISIHAPLRERLYQKHRLYPYNRISIHAPLRERPEIDG